MLSNRPVEPKKPADLSIGDQISPFAKAEAVRAQHKIDMQNYDAARKQYIIDEKVWFAQELQKELARQVDVSDLAPALPAPAPLVAPVNDSDSAPSFAAPAVPAEESESSTPAAPADESDSSTEVVDLALAINADANVNSAATVASVKAESEYETETEEATSSNSSVAVSTASAKRQKKVTINSDLNVAYSPVGSAANPAVPAGILGLNIPMDDNDDDSDLNSAKTSEEPTYSAKKYIPVILGVVTAVVVLGLIAAALFVPGVAPLLGIAVVAGASTSLFSAVAGAIGLAGAISACAGAAVVVASAFSAFVAFVAKKVITPKQTSVNSGSDFESALNTSASSVSGSSSGRVLSAIGSTGSYESATPSMASAASMHVVSEQPVVAEKLAPEMQRRSSFTM